MKQSNPWIKALQKCAKRYQQKKKTKVEKQLRKVILNKSSIVRLRNKYAKKPTLN